MKTLPNEIRCPKCNGRMITGLVPDVNQSAHFQASWVSSRDVRKTRWNGLVLPMKKWLGMHYAVQASKVFPVAAYRCESCGFLEFYAPISREETPV